MIADSNYLNGGGTTIFSRSAKNKASSQEYSMVNRLILSCGTSKESLSTLYTMFKSSVFAIAYSITSDYHLSEDCVTETFVRLSQVRNFDPNKGDGKGFILTIARNVALELNRSFKRESDNIYVQHYGEADTTVENSIYINELLGSLKKSHRQIVVMRCCSELSFKEIAKIMKLPESTVKSRYSRAITLLQKKAGVKSER